jgi:LCP family protein required for cell wall assembly
MLVHAELGGVRKLSIPRDTEAEIPGHGSRKINAAYALGGPALTIDTVENFLGNGLEINHLVEVDFKDFPAFIDALGGITVNNKTRICSPPFDNFWKGIHFRKGELHLDGTRALGYARVRKNPCAPAEDDRARAARQQEVLRAIGAQAKSPGTFFRLPWVAWAAPKALRTDMGGFSLLGLVGAELSGGSAKPTVLTPTGAETLPDGGAGLTVDDAAKQRAVERFLNG